MGLFRKRAPQNDCIYCARPLSGKHDGWAHADCERVVRAANEETEITDRRDPDLVEHDLRQQERCPWQLQANGWDGSARYCGREITDTGGDDPDLFCLEHQCDFYGDDEGAAQERWEYTEHLLEQAGLRKAI
jgi:hypothetical protein